MSKITAVIIACNEEHHIAKCVESVKDIVDEIVVVDSHSTDNTPQICRDLGATVISYDWKGYSQNKNYGNQEAKHDYILSLDADEYLSEELKLSISEVKNSLYGVYSFNRLTNYCGKWIHHCGWYPDKKIRLFNKNDAYWQGQFVHEVLRIKSGTPLTHLAGNLLHHSFQSLTDHIERVNRYSSLAAKEIYKGQSHFSAYLNLLFNPFFKFVKCYILQKGFLDGLSGFSISIISAFDILLRYAKVLELKHTHGNLP